MGKLDGKTALITGGSSGIGLAAAKRFVDEGAYVFITGRREAELASAAKDIGKNVKALQGDVSNLDDLDRIVAQIKEIKGKLDIVFANAGVAKYAALGEITEELYDPMFFPKIPSDLNWHDEVELLHRQWRCLRSFMHSGRSSPTCSSRVLGLKPRTSFSVIS